MRLRNSSGIPDATVREIIRFACPAGVTGFDIKVATAKQRNRYLPVTIKGRAYGHGSAYHDRAVAFTNLYVGPDAVFPSVPQPPYRPGYLGLPYFADRIEALVFLAAHELRHLWQAKHRKGYRVWGARGTYSERDADAYALRTLRAWRKRTVTP